MFAYSILKCIFMLFVNFLLNEHMMMVDLKACLISFSARRFASSAFFARDRDMRLVNALKSKRPSDAVQCQHSITVV